MPHIIQLSLTPAQSQTSENIQKAISEHLNTPKENISDFRLLKRSIDARKRKVKIQLKVEVFINEKIPKKNINRNYQDVSRKEEIVIVGSGPAGLFAALKLIELGLKQIVLERGKDVQSIRRDIAAINKQHIVNSDSNYCFGEGGQEHIPMESYIQDLKKEVYSICFRNHGIPWSQRRNIDRCTSTYGTNKLRN